MRLNKKFLPAILFCGVVALSSCEKSEQDIAQPDFEQGMISQIMADSAEVTSYAFAGKQLSQINHYDKESGELESFDRFERDGKGKLIKTSTHAGGNHALLSEQSFTYNTDGLLTKSKMVYYNGSKVEYTGYATYSYDAQNKLEKKSVFEGEEQEKATPKSYTTYSVLPNGNYTQEEQYVIDDKGEEKLFSVSTYSYDNSINPFHEFAEPGTASSPNNLIAATTVVSGSNKTYEYAYAYTYDERGYPLTQTVNTPTGKREVFTYVYSN
ncbi:hypothetical protein CLV24_101350 [Pontibacter ummariensis]|uniref:Uncharacterized protein n=1 Tax=Pontibacter ummariensis TaxID=1610492 RepID=A0A239BH50_9BACT|nr:hypothetical protein [Pontibacter ummariensis]PRY16504.1 hypothetical protein CLV24_101350 [Pontibacter ummariensis]SNS06353.1 hypothetical protein SAMN06296052_101350 [Pontibacter ummariensis]